MKPLYIFDIDGTLANNKHRAHLAPPKDQMHLDLAWKPWGDMCLHDTPHRHIVELANLLILQNYDVWFWSARSARHAHDTALWLAHHVIQSPLQFDAQQWYDYLQTTHNLKMRPIDLCEHDLDLKRSWLHALTPDDRNRLRGIFEDRNSVVDMWREEGVNVFHVAEAKW